MSKRLPIGLALLVTSLLASAPSAAQAKVEEGHPEWRDNYVTVGASLVGITGWQTVRLDSPALETEAECVSAFFGGIKNEGSPLVGRGSILSWEASGDASKTGTELDRECHFKKGTAAVEAWMTDEPALVQTGTEGQHGSPLTVPWNIELRCGEREEEPRAIVKIGVPTGSTPVTGCKSEEEEKAEIEKEENERKGCYASPVPAGCIKIDVAQPMLGLETVFEGTLRALAKNGGGNGLNFSRWKFEGEKSGKLRLSSEFVTTSTVTGEIALVGFGSTELIQAR